MTSMTLVGRPTARVVFAVAIIIASVIPSLANEDATAESSIDEGEKLFALKVKPLLAEKCFAGRRRLVR